MSPATIAQYSLLLTNPACALKEVHLSGSSRSKIPAEFYDAIALRKPAVVNVDVCHKLEQTQQFVDFLKFGRAPTDTQYNVGYCHPREILISFLADIQTSSM
jgi:hypothetical protein